MFTLDKVAPTTFTTLYVGVLENAEAMKATVCFSLALWPCNLTHLRSPPSGLISMYISLYLME